MQATLWIKIKLVTSEQADLSIPSDRERIRSQASCYALQADYDVLGGYMSPVHTAYSKKGLAPAEHRVRMCELAAETSPLIMVDSWEAAQKHYQYSLHVLQHLEHAVNEACSTGVLM